VTTESGRSADDTDKIRRRGNGRWYWQDDLGRDPETNRRIRPTRERATREELVIAREEALAELGTQPQTAPPAADTVADWLAEWLRSISARSDRSPNTYTNYESACRNHIVPAIGHLMLADLTSKRVAAMLESKTPATRQAVHKALSVAWADAWRAQKVTDKDLLLRVPRVLPAVSNTGPAGGADFEAAVLKSMNAPVALAKEGMRARDQVLVLRTLEDERLRSRWLLGMVYGPRQSEALGFAWPDLEPVGKAARLWIRRVRIRQEWAHGCHRDSPCHLSPNKCPRRIQLPPVKEPKTIGSERVLHLSPNMLAILLDWRARQSEEFAQLGVTPRIPWMFTDVYGKPPSHSDDNKAWQDVLSRAGVSRHYSLHNLRHTAASEAAANPDIDLQTLMGMFGWTRRQTVETYAHARDDRLQLAWEQQEARFLPPDSLP
jgi:integrase